MYRVEPGALADCSTRSDIPGHGAAWIRPRIHTFHISCARLHATDFDLAGERRRTLACSGGGGNGGTTQPPAAAPAISLSSAAANFSATAGAASPAAQAVTVTNSGTGTLSGLAVGTIAYAGGPTGGWLSASLSAATAPTTMALTPSTNGLLAGTYTATVPISSVASGVTNSPQSVSLTLTVGPGPATHLGFAPMPSPTAGGVMTPPVTVSIYDALGDLVTTATTSVTLAIGANGSGAVLSGTTTVAAVAGVATFSSLSVSKPGSGFNPRRLRHRPDRRHECRLHGVVVVGRERDARVGGTIHDVPFVAELRRGAGRATRLAVSRRRDQHGSFVPRFRRASR